MTHVFFTLDKKWTMIPSHDTFIRFDGDDWASITDGRCAHAMPVVARGPGADPQLATAIIARNTGAWEISYEISTGRVIDIADAAMPDVTQLVPAGTEASHV